METHAFALQIRVASTADAAAIVAIYNHYVLNTTISFEEQPVTESQMAGRISACLEAGFPWLVAEAEDGIAGYAYATKWRERPAYRHSVETSVYLDPAKTGRGAGRQLYTALLRRLRDSGRRTVIAGIAQPNPASVGLHEALGFVPAAMFKEVGFKQNQWLDVGYWQLALHAFQA